MRVDDHAEAAVLADQGTRRCWVAYSTVMHRRLFQRDDGDGAARIDPSVVTVVMRRVELTTLA